jgi:hypothetical protein
MEVMADLEAYNHMVAVCGCVCVCVLHTMLFFVMVDKMCLDEIGTYSHTENHMERAGGQRKNDSSEAA